MEHDEILSVIEGMLFLSGDEGLTIKQISSVLQIGKKEATTYVDELIQVINERAVKGFELVNFGGVFKLITFSSHHEFYQRMIEQNENTLSNAALETLAIIAYNPKITRAEIEAIRGVSADACVYKLLEYGLIEEAGKIDLPGKPMSYKTTNDFLRMFGYSSLEELPELPRYKLDENKQIVIEDLIEEREAPEPHEGEGGVKDEEDNKK